PSSRGTKAAPKVFLTSDDLIPILVFVIIQAKLEKLHTNMAYIQSFSTDIGSSELGFTVASFEAAVKHLQSPEVLKLVGERPPASSSSSSSTSSLPSSSSISSTLFC